MSFNMAAAKLNLTQSAVSHQIRRLEEQLGLPLFIRHNRELVLTRRHRTICLLSARPSKNSAQPPKSFTAPIVTGC
jgi:LysR family glycine cleavage system transcriptional activator